MMEMELICISLLISLLAIIETTEEPCSTANDLPVINICSNDTRFQNESRSFLIKADTMLNCSCKLSVIDQENVIKVTIQRYDQRKSSSPSTFECGLILKFDIGGNAFWAAQCLVGSQIVSQSITVNNVMTIRSLIVYGTLKQNEGYCIEIRKEVNDSIGNNLKLTCGPESNTTYSTKIPIAERTLTLTFMTTTTTKHMSTTYLDPDKFISATEAITDMSTRQKTQQQKDKGTDDTTVYVAIPAIVCGVGAIIFITIIVLFCRRFRISRQSKNRTRLGSHTIYDTLSLPSPANIADNTSYSFLNIYEVQSSYDNRRFAGSQSLPLSTISAVQGGNTKAPENDTNDTNDRNTIKKRIEYANLVC